MPETIRDGTGGGNLAVVDDGNLLGVRSVTESAIGHESHENYAAYAFSTPMLTQTLTGGRMLFFRNDSDVDFHLDMYAVSYNGGSTNHDRCCTVYIGVTDTAHDTNVTSGTMGNMNKGANVTADATILYWDEVGDGMTGGTAGGTGCRGMVSKGRTTFPAVGAIIIPPNGTFTIRLVVEEVGEAQCSLRGYFA